ncbi:MAG: HAD family hydrolase [Janthinobacterium lividum]
MGIKNVVFDIGNVLVNWEPYRIIHLIFPEVEAEEFYKEMRPIWIDLNLGKLTEQEAINKYAEQFDIDADKMTSFMNEVKKQQTPIIGSLELLQKLDKSGIKLYSITDNIKEIIQYHLKNSDFPRYFKDIIISADIGVLKPDSKIYQYLLDKHALEPSECVFIDDLIVNVEGAISAGMYSFQFTNMDACEQQLIALGVELRQL